MRWRYNRGLSFTVIVLVMWVTYAEITRGICEEYKHPFIMAYLGTSLLVLYLPVASITSWLYLLLRYLSCRISDRTCTNKRCQYNSIVLNLGLFTLFIGAALGHSINAAKVVSVVISMAGVAMTTLGKTWSTDGSQLSKSTNGKHSLVGDLFAILSALTLLLKKFTGEGGEKVDMQKLYGYIGLFSLVALWWLSNMASPLTAMGIEPEFTIPHSAKMEGILFANCFVGSFLCDYFWALGVVWTTPLVAALGVSLTIPLAMLADMVVHGQHYSAIYIIGSAQVFVGFVMVNFSNWFSQKLKLLPFIN
ncbi:uncharacterized vacuolar membrane protein YML018C-like [Cornus florida]|uniref:uncharacterized vacuolar membrane protein YML018C-like n=1 Tax=Cornus florida TaxID=4283 RepID=UPI00289C4F33|nr:uncharacterized vacuolar membrane protein YML018C-like [Cornus florida]